MEYTKGMKLEFIIYGTIVKGDFVELDGDNIIIMTTHDFIKETIGKTQSIHKSYKHYKVDE